MLQGAVARVYARVSPGIGRRFAPQRTLRDEILALVARQTPAESGRRLRVLDLAPGPGELTLALGRAGHDVVGVEPSAALRAAAARRTAGAHVVIAATLADDRPFDVVVSVHALYADPAWEDRLRLALQALRPGGIAILVNFAAPFPVWASSRAVARREGVRAGAASLLWLVPNALFDGVRRPRTARYWRQEVFEERVATAGFEIAEVRRTFLNGGSVLIVARRPEPAPTPVLQPEDDGERAGERCVARAVLYEIAEAVRFEAVRDDEPIWVRHAEATVFGKDVVSPGAGPLFPAGSLIVGRARSSVVVPGHRGPLHCAFDVLVDSAPDRPSLDKLLVAGSGALEGHLDLRGVSAGHATAGGTWTRGRRSGRFIATFSIPITRPGHDGYWYVGADGDGPRQLRDDELVLGFPATKIVISVFEAVEHAG